MKNLAYWQKTCLALTALTLLASLPFWLTDLDVWLAGRYYDPEGSRAFPLKYAPFWYALYKLIPILSAVIALGSIALITLSYLNQNFTRFRRPAIAVFLTFLLGPGLFVNGVFKENYGRPRPQQVDVFGGPYPYVPLLAYGGYEKAKSFPSGHASVAFACLIFYFLLRRKKPRLANIVGVSALIFGALTGMARIVGGGHFLSDVLWSFYMVALTAVIVEYVIVERPSRPSSHANPRQKKIATIIATFLSAALIAWLLLSLPFEKTRAFPINIQDISAIRLDSDNGRYTIEYQDHATPTVIINTEGYGLKPFVHEKMTQARANGHLSLHVSTQGFHRDAQQNIRLVLPTSAKAQIEVTLPSKK